MRRIAIREQRSHYFCNSEGPIVSLLQNLITIQMWFPPTLSSSKNSTSPLPEGVAHLRCFPIWSEILGLEWEARSGIGANKGRGPGSPSSL